MPVRHDWEDAEGDYNPGDDSPSSEQDPSGADSIAISALRMVAWLDLVAGVIGGFVALPNLEPLVGRAVAVIIALSLVLQGLVIWALFLSLASIATNLQAIRDSSSSKPG